MKASMEVLCGRISNIRIEDNKMQHSIRRKSKTYLIAFELNNYFL